MIELAFTAVDTRARHRAVLCLLAAVYVGLMLLDRHQQSDEGRYLEMARGLVGPILLVCAVLLLYESMRLFVRDRTAFCASAALGLYVPAYVLLPSLHSEIPALFAVVLFMYASTRDLRGPRLRYLVLGAFALAYLAVTRVVFGWIVTGALLVWLAVWLLRRDPRSSRLVAMNVLALVLCVPWLAHTYAVSDNVFYWGSSGGLSLYWMASPHPGQLGDWHDGKEVFSNPHFEPNRPEFGKLETGRDISNDAVLRRDAARLILDHPVNYAANVANNMSRLWFNLPYSFTPEHLGTLLYIVPNALLLSGLLACGYVFLLDRQRFRFELWGFVVLLALGVGFQALLAAYARMLTPLVPIIVALVAVAFAGGEPGTQTTGSAGSNPTLIRRRAVRIAP